MAVDNDVSMEFATRAEDDMRTDDAKGADLAAGPKLGAGVNNGGGMNDRVQTLLRLVDEHERHFRLAHWFVVHHAGPLGLADLAARLGQFHVNY